MSKFQVIMRCTHCQQSYRLVLEPGTKGKANCKNCNAVLFEFTPVIGYVYILSNPSIPGTVKIGQTRSSVEERARQLFTTGVPTPFDIEAFFHSGDPAGHEQEIHRKLARYRLDGREYFKIGAEAALKVVRSVMGTPPAYTRPALKRRIEAGDLSAQIKILSDD